ncbi:OmpA family protein [Celeribacter sp. PS-C1]|uniref:OmpA family protein n=1 Tax=Celeribacter sp. PS-C1 TaxID=2820813 RepID=UPI001C671B61|nr:OmpA family protein [Celeribacter sp. PS-C1]MBW6418849.1 OmpA family protein [Celeribacter sp. PS-C1]
MKRMIFGTAATGLCLASLGATWPAYAQDAALETELAAELELEACDDIAPPCMTSDNTVMLKDGTEVSLEEAYEALGIAAPRAEVEAEVAVGEEMAEDVATEETAPEEVTTAGEEAVADMEHAEVVEEEVIAEELAEEVPEADAQVAEDAEEAPIDPVAEAEVDPETVENPASGEIVMETEEAVGDAPAAPEVAEEAAPEAESETLMADDAQEEGALGALLDRAETLLQDRQTDESLEAAMTEEAQAEQAAEEAEMAADLEAEQNSAAAAAMENPEAEAEVDVVTETVTEETARSSADEILTTNNRSKNDDGGMSDREKLLLGAVSAVVLSQILGNDDQVVSNTGDRVVVENNGQLRVLKNDDVLLRQPGSQVTTESFPDGSARTTTTREDGSKVITVRAADGRVLRRDRVLADGTVVTLFDDTRRVEAVDVSALPDSPQRTETYRYAEDEEEDALRAALAASQARAEGLNRSFSLNQIRSIRAVRELAPEIELTNVNFRSGSAAITPSEAEELAALGRAMRDAIAENPREVFLVEGHTDAVGNASYNLALSDRRAESLALALTEYFDVPPENMIIQGYGERYLKVPTVDAERANRRAAVRVITPLLGEVVASGQ